MTEKNNEQQPWEASFLKNRKQPVNTHERKTDASLNA